MSRRSKKTDQSYLLVPFFRAFLKAAIFVSSIWEKLYTPYKRSQKVLPKVYQEFGRYKSTNLKSRILLPRFQNKEEHFTRIVFIPHLTIKLRYFVLGIAVAGVIIASREGYFFISALPNPTLIGKVNYPVSTQIFDRGGKLIYEIYSDQNRTPIKLSEIPDYIPKSTIAIEDKDFYKHQGISIFSGVVRAAKDTFILKKGLQGGSTITQQLVKSALLTPERTLTRKIKEAILAIWAEKVYAKDQILEMYLNQVPYGGSAYGIEEAAKTYFGKQAKNLSLEEAAFLAGLPQAPTFYSPYKDPEMSIRRRNEVLKKMYELKYIKREDYQAKIKMPLTVKAPNHIIKAPHFVFYVKSHLEDIYGPRQIEERGFRVTTTLDLDVQEKAETILKDELEAIKGLNVSNGGVLVTTPGSGEILAMVGSVNYYASPSGAFNVTTADRQPGSSGKPLLYSLALERGYTAATMVDDSPVVYHIAGSESYRPVNYDNRFHGRVPVRAALANSYNVPAVKVLNTIGVDNYVKHARKMGITTWSNPDRYGLSLALGGGEVRMVDMAVAFGTFANKGTRIDLNPILKISDFTGNTIYEAGRAEGPQVISEEIAFIISNILSDNKARLPAFGTRSFLEIPDYTVAVKTGTTNDKKDNWTIGYTPRYLAAVWVGNNDNTPMNPFLTSGITGAAPIWNKIMKYVMEKDIKSTRVLGTTNNAFEEPKNIVKKNCYMGKVEYFIKGTEGRVNCNVSLTSPTPSPKP